MVNNVTKERYECGDIIKDNEYNHYGVILGSEYVPVFIGDCDFHGDSPLSTKKPHLPTQPQHFYYTTRTAAAQGPNLHKSDAATL